MLWRIILVVALWLAAVAHADNSYRCTRDSGQMTRSRNPCVGSKTETASQKTGTDRRQLQSKQRPVTEEEQAFGGMFQQVMDLLKEGRLEEAKALAQQNGLDFEQLLDEYQNAGVERQRQRQQEELERQRQQQAFARQRQRMANQRAAIARKRDELAKRQSAQRAQREGIGKQRNSYYTYPDSRVPLSNRGQPSSPQYVPSVGGWCQQQHNVISCRK